MENKLTNSWPKATAAAVSGYAITGGATDSTPRINFDAFKNLYFTIFCLGIFYFGTSSFGIFEFFFSTLRFVVNALFLQIAMDSLLVLCQIAVQCRDAFSLVVLALVVFSFLVGYIILAKLELLPNQIASDQAKHARVHEKTMAKLGHDHAKEMAKLQYDHEERLKKI